MNDTFAMLSCSCKQYVFLLDSTKLVIFSFIFISLSPFKGQIIRHKNEKYLMPLQMRKANIFCHIRYDILMLYTHLGHNT